MRHFLRSSLGWAIAVYDGGWWAWVQNPVNPLAVGYPSNSLERRGRMAHSGSMTDFYEELSAVHSS
jgi:hypothetical protein